MPSPETILKTTFGYDSFRPLQREVIGNVLARQNSLAIMPTGGGKSLCYQIPALFLNSTLSPEAYSDNMDCIRRGQAKLLYVTPKRDGESQLALRILALLAEVKVDCLTIDEAHCISEWGHDFRPEYRQLADARRRWSDAVCLALTATATPRVRMDILISLGFKAANEFVASFNRENLFIEVAPKRDGESQLARFLQRFKEQSGIIYSCSDIK